MSMAVRLTLKDAEERARRAVSALTEYASVVDAFLFGSYVEGRADEWSDIDIAVFIEDFDEYTLSRRVKTNSQIHKKEGYDIELHYFPAEALTDAEPASFAAYVIKHGRSIEIAIEQVE